MNNHSKINCPICGKHNTWSKENNFKPFCSDRCKLIDLGEWANETRKIPGQEHKVEHLDTIDKEFE